MFACLFSFEIAAGRAMGDDQKLEVRRVQDIVDRVREQEPAMVLSEVRARWAAGALVGRRSP